METSINGLIEKIKKDGVEKAEEEAAKIIAAAEEKSAKLVQDANEQAEELLSKARSDAEKLKKNAETTIRQAARDVILGLRGSITALFDSIVKRETGKALDPDTMKKMLVILAEKFTPQEQLGIEVVLAEKDKNQMNDIFISELGKEMAGGIKIMASKDVENGFRIGQKESGVYYDFTDEAISEALNSYLNKGLLAILSADSKNG